MAFITNSKNYIENEFPELTKYKRTTSRRYEKTDNPKNKDNWWFKFSTDDLIENEFIVFAGAMDYQNRDFKIFKVPSEFIKSNLAKLSVVGDGWVNLYVHMNSYSDIRHRDNLSFKDFVIN